MRGLLLPSGRVVLRLPAVRCAALLLVAAPAFVQWWGQDDQAPVRLLVVGLLLAAVAAMTWDDRCAVLVAPTPVGLPAVWRGRVLVVLALLLTAWGLSALAARGQDVPYAAVALQTVAFGSLLVALVGWLARDREGEQTLALPLPVMIVTLVVLSRLPADIALLRARPGTAGWPDERLRWWALLGASAAVVAWLGRDPAGRRFRALGPATRSGRARAERQPVSR